MSPLLYSIGRWAFRARKLVLILWLALFVALAASAGLFNKGTDNSFSIPGTQSQEALNSLSRTFPQVSGTSAQIVIVVPKGETVNQPSITNAVADAVGKLDKVHEVQGVSSPFNNQIKDAISHNGQAAIITVQLDGQPTTVSAETKKEITSAGQTLERALPHGSQISIGGALYSQTLPSVSVVELVGLLIALVVLFLTFGSILAAGMPLATALLGVLISISLIFLSTLFGPISSTTPLLALMLGLAVGIDYSLFIISRHQGQLKAGIDPEESAARAVATAGSAVLFAGMTVIIALAGLAVAGIPFLTTMGFAASLAVAVAVIVALTLTPAFLGFAGARITPGRHPQRRRRRRTATMNSAALSGVESGETMTLEHSSLAEIPRGPYRTWVRAVTRFPLVTIVAVILALGFASVPALQLRLALPDAGSLAQGDPARTTYDLITDHFGPGYNGPLIVTGSIISSKDPVTLMNDIGKDIARLPGVAAVPLATPNATADTGIVQVIPTTGPDDPKTTALVDELRSKNQYFKNKYGVNLQVTGTTAVLIDVSTRLGDALLPFGILVVGLSLILLTMVFRSIAVPIKAALGYLLSVGTAFGAVTVVFEWGWLANLLNVSRTGPVISFLPIILMGVLFGLAMDYEVFLVSRMREDYVHGKDANRAVQSGFVGSARVVTAAAIIMAGVFAAFIPEGDNTIKPMAVGLTVGVFVDAFIVRMTLVPAVMKILGDKAWWMPRWLDRVLPKFDVEGDGLQKELDLADWPEPGSPYIVAAENLSVASRGIVLLHPVDLRLRSAESLIVETGDREAGRALSLAVTGRTRFSGTLKTAQFALPMRSATVRSRTAMIRLETSATPVTDVRLALRRRPLLLVLDAADAVADSAQRAQLREVIDRAFIAAQKDDQPFAVLATCVDPHTVTEILPNQPASISLTPSQKIYAR